MIISLFKELKWMIGSNFPMSSTSTITWTVIIWLKINLIKILQLTSSIKISLLKSSQRLLPLLWKKLKRKQRSQCLLVRKLSSHQLTPNPFYSRWERIRWHHRKCKIMKMYFSWVGHLLLKIKNLRVMLILLLNKR